MSFKPWTHERIFISIDIQVPEITFMRWCHIEVMEVTDIISYPRIHIYCYGKINSFHLDTADGSSYILC